MASEKKIPLFILFFTILSFSLPILPSHGAPDPSPLQDFCIADLDTPTYLNGFACKNPANATSKDFFFEGFKGRGTQFNSLKVNLTRADVRAFPALNTLGMSMNRVQFLPGGLNPPHIHPRSAELALAVEGDILVGFVSTEYVLYTKNVSAGEVFVIPPGLVHFELNVGAGNATFYASFNSQNPGISKIAPTLFNSNPLISHDALAKAFNVNNTIIDLIISQVARWGNPPIN